MARAQFAPLRTDIFARTLFFRLRLPWTLQIDDAADKHVLALIDFKDFEAISETYAINANAFYCEGVPDCVDAMLELT